MGYIIDFQRPAPSLEQITAMVRELIKELDVAREADRSAERKVKFAVCAVIAAGVWSVYTVRVFENALFGAFWLMGVATMFLVAIGFPFPKRAFEKFAKKYVAVGYFDFSEKPFAYTEQYLTSPADTFEIELIRVISHEQAFAPLRPYLVSVLEERCLTSFEYGQIMAWYMPLAEQVKIEREIVAARCKGQKLLGKLKSIQAEGSVS